MRRRLLLALGLLAVFGAAKLPVERALYAEQRASYFHGGRLSIDMRERLGQDGYLAALSGFRSVVADLLWIEANTAWQRTEWGKMKVLFDNVTALQPRTVMFWDMAGWHMAWNASVAAFNDPKQPSEALRIRAQRQYFELGRDYYERGVKNNPDRWQMYGRLANLYQDKLNQPCEAAENYAQAAKIEGAPAYMERFAAYRLAECPGHEREAYETLRELYQRGEEQRLPTLLTKLRELQEKLEIPEAERLDLPPAPSNR